MVMLCLASFARIFLGVHYASDCIFGAVQGLVICLLGTGLWKANLLGCVSCHDNACYAEPGSDNVLNFSNLSEMSLLPFFIVVVLSVIVSLFMVVRPIRFWRKCDRSLGYVSSLLFYYLYLSSPEFLVLIVSPRPTIVYCYPV